MKKIVAYFSPEYAIENNLPLYAGGLGVLAGDHLKSCNDENINLVAIGLFYRNGYFKQKITKNGTQKSEYYRLNPNNLPLTPLKNEYGDSIVLSINFADSKLNFQVFEYKIGNVTLYLLDTFLMQNTDEHLNITDKLYGGTRERRIQQEILLGMGGIKLLEYLEIKLDIIHINEGHAAFALLEHAKNYSRINNLDFFKSIDILKKSNLFTTHTPVTHGNEVFSVDLIKKYFSSFCEGLSISFDDFVNLGKMQTTISNSIDDVDSLIAKNDLNESEFSMTILAFKLCGMYNAVSKLHCETSRNLWQNVFKVTNPEDVPIDYITNGVYHKYWLAKDANALLSSYLPENWSSNISNEETYKNLQNISDSEIVKLRSSLRYKLISFIRNKFKVEKPEFLKRDKFKTYDEILSPEALTIGFSRRFAPYKRADLLFRDMERLINLLKNRDMAVQFVFSGKAHPMDTEGKEMLKNVIKSITDNNLERSIVFLENYELETARVIVQGCDLWLNNPIKPLEASGTSGMKSAMNGGINFSILDGWWAEAYNEQNGFLLKDEETEIETANNLYDELENNILPLFYYDKIRWVEIIRQSMKTALLNYNSSRMVLQYQEKFYK